MNFVDWKCSNMNLNSEGPIPTFYVIAGSNSHNGISGHIRQKNLYHVHWNVILCRIESMRQFLKSFPNIVFCLVSYMRIAEFIFSTT